MSETPRDLTRTVLALLFIGMLIALSLWILRPFLASLVWATMIVVATWPVLLALQRRLWGRRWIATALMSLLLVLVLVVPFTLAVATLLDHTDLIVTWTKNLVSAPPTQIPAWLERIPLVGSRAADAWRNFVTAEQTSSAQLVPYLGNAVRWFAAQFGSAGLIAVQFLLTIILCTILFATGENAADAVRRFAVRLAGERGEISVRLAAQAIRGVAIGVIGTAIAQSVLAGLGLWVCGVPFVAILTTVAFMLCLAQLGPFFVLAPAAGWLYWTGDTGWGTVLLVWALLVSAVDNVIRPLLIMKGADLPLLLIFAGVVGGLLGFGPIGIFVGPVVLAVSYTLVVAWVEEDAGIPPRGTARTDVPAPAPPQ